MPKKEGKKSKNHNESSKVLLESNEDFSAMMSYHQNFLQPIIQGQALISAENVINACIENVLSSEWEKETLKQIPEFNVERVV